MNYKNKYLKYKLKYQKLLKQKGGIFVKLNKEMLDNDLVQDFKSVNHSKSCSHCVAGFLGLDENTEFWSELFNLLKQTPNEGILNYDFKKLINKYELDIEMHNKERILGYGEENKFTTILDICNIRDVDIEYTTNKCGELDYDDIYNTLLYYVPTGYCTILSHQKHDREIGHFVIICNVPNNEDEDEDKLHIIDIHQNFSEYDDDLFFTEEVKYLSSGRDEINNYLSNSKYIILYTEGLYLTPVPTEHLKSSPRGKKTYYNEKICLGLDCILPIDSK